MEVSRHKGALGIKGAAFQASMDATPTNLHINEVLGV